MLEVRDIVAKLGDFTLRVSLSAAEGETLVVAGPSGCGKSTLINLILGLIAPNSGKIFVGGRDITALPPWKRNMAAVFQDAALFPHLDAGKNIEFALSIRKIPAAERAKIVEATLELVNLRGFARRRVDTLSGGEKQRVALARALAVNPAALLLDEPFSSLDPPLRGGLIAELRAIRLRTRAPWLLVTHNPDEALLLGDRAALFENGVVVEEGAPAALARDSQTSFAARFFAGAAAAKNEK